MKKFLLTGFFLLMAALLVAVVVFYYLSFKLTPPTKVQDSEVAADTEGVEYVAKSSVTSTPAVDIPLRDLPLGETQKEVLESVGVDVATFVITPAMQDCASLKLGAERLDEIVAGASPSAWETAQLLPCMRAE